MCVKVSLYGWPGCAVLLCLCILTGPQQVMIYDVTLAETVVAGAGNTDRQNSVLIIAGLLHLALLDFLAESNREWSTSDSGMGKTELWCRFVKPLRKRKRKLCTNQIKWQDRGQWFLQLGLWVNTLLVKQSKLFFLPLSCCHFPGPGTFLWLPSSLLAASSYMEGFWGWRSHRWSVKYLNEWILCQTLSLELYILGPTRSSGPFWAIRGSIPVFLDEDTKE